MAYHYTVPPQGYVRYEYNNSSASSPSTSPSPDGGYAYYIPQPYRSPSKKEYGRHVRHESYGTPRRPSGWHAPADFPSPAHYTKQPNYASPPPAGKHQEHVSREGDRIQSRTRRYSTSADHRGGGHWGGGTGYTVKATTLGASPSTPRRQPSVQTQSPKQRIIIDTSDSADDSPSFAYIKPRKQHQPQQYYYSEGSPRHPHANPTVFYAQVPSPASRDKYDSPASSHQRSKSFSQRRASVSRPTTAGRSSSKDVEPSREANATDARKHRIPAGYSLKNWDPEEAPIMLLGSVFDANSLGKWIYDWTVYYHGPATPMSEVAGDLWLLLIKLAHKMKRADEALPRIRNYDDEELLEDFLESCDRLWSRFKKLLKHCEEYMWKVAKKEGSKASSPTTIKMGKNSGCEFVESIFGRDRQLEETEGLMQSIRLWNMRFDSNCEDVIRHAK